MACERQGGQSPPSTASKLATLWARAWLVGEFSGGSKREVTAEISAGVQLPKPGPCISSSLLAGGGQRRFCPCAAPLLPGSTGNRPPC